MKTTTRPRSAPSRWMHAIVTAALVVGQMVQPVYAQLTPLADQPIAAKVAAKPNIFYTLDDSGSMKLNYIPDYIGDVPTTTAVTKIVRVGTTGTATVASTAPLTTGDWLTLAGFNYPEYNGVFQITVAGPTTFTITVPATASTPTGAGNYTTGSRYCRGGQNTANCSVVLQNSNANWISPPFFAGDFNRMMYNPSVLYTPPLKWDGLPFTAAVPFTATNIDANGNQGNGLANYKLVQRDPYNQLVASTTRDNLTTNVTVPLYCNTDWPSTAGVNLALNPDVGDANGEYLAGSGGWCRINGTKYDASVASGAPATAVAGVEYGYNYPWQSSTGAVGAQYFWKNNVANKTLWCDQTSPYYPRNTATHHRLQWRRTGDRRKRPAILRCERQFLLPGWQCIGHVQPGQLQDRPHRPLLHRRDRGIIRDHARDGHASGMRCVHLQCHQAAGQPGTLQHKDRRQLSRPRWLGLRSGELS